MSRDDFPVSPRGQFLITLPFLLLVCVFSSLWFVSFGVSLPVLNLFIVVLIIVHKMAEANFQPGCFAFLFRNSSKKHNLSGI